MKVIDLLNLVYEKKAPKKILYKYCEYEFNSVSNDYENKSGLELFSYLFRSEEQALYFEVEIIEEIEKPKKIEKIDDILRYDDLRCPYGENEEKFWKNIIINHNKLNEVIDKLNYLLEKSKDDEI